MTPHPRHDGTHANFPTQAAVDLWSTTPEGISRDQSAARHEVGRTGAEIRTRAYDPVKPRN